MIWNDLESLNKRFLIIFFSKFGNDTRTFHEKIAQKYLEIDQYNMHITVLLLNVNFDNNCSSPDPMDAASVKCTPKKWLFFRY